jgi:hypothetical protein
MTVTVAEFGCARGVLMHFRNSKEDGDLDEQNAVSSNDSYRHTGALDAAS